MRKKKDRATDSKGGYLKKEEWKTIQKTNKKRRTERGIKRKPKMKI